MRQYELTVLIHPDLEMNLQPALDKIAKIIEDAGGKITKETNEGKKRLAYEIAKQDFAVYYYYEIDLPSATQRGCAQKITSSLDIADEVIRHLLVIVDDDRRKAKERKAQKEKEEASKEAEETEANTEEEK